MQKLKYLLKSSLPIGMLLLVAMLSATLLSSCAANPFKAASQNGTFVTVNAGENLKQVNVEVVTKSEQESAVEARQNATQETKPQTDVNLNKGGLPSSPSIPLPPTGMIGRNDESASAKTSDKTVKDFSGESPAKIPE